MSNRLNLSLAVGAYEHVRDLASGEVTPTGIALNTMHLPIEEILYRTHNFREWDVAELGMGGYVSALSRGEQPYVAIPVFTSRVFRHSCIYVREDANIHKPGDLVGKRIGMPEWGMAAAVWARGMLADFYGFDPRSARWVQGGLHLPGRVDRAPPSPALGIDYTVVSDRALDDMLAAGEIDALFSARVPNCFARGGHGVRRLFQHLHGEEKHYWSETKIFPIMHLVGMRREVYEANRWAAKSLTDAFESAKNRSLARACDTSSSYFPVPLMLHAVEQARAIGGDDFWPYGLEANRPTLEAFLRYAHQQGITARQLSADELFAPETAFKTST